MSYRHDAELLEVEVAALREEVRRLRHTATRGPTSFGGEVFVARGVVGFGTTDDTFAGTPSGDPFHFLLSVTVELRAGRVYRAEGLTRVGVVTVGQVAVELARDLQTTSTPTFAGDGVATHTTLGAERFDAEGVGSTHDRSPVAWWLQADDESDVEVALVVENGLDVPAAPPWGASTLAVVDMGRLP